MESEKAYNHAPELRVSRWIDASGNPLDMRVRLDDLGNGYKVLFCFQDWCPGCHSRGFPTLKLLHETLKDRQVGFAAIQTVFEGAQANTFDKLKLNQDKYELAIPFGHDVPLPGRRLPSFMEDYETGGTPWFTIIDPTGEIVFADFHLDLARFLRTPALQPSGLAE